MDTIKTVTNPKVGTRTVTGTYVLRDVETMKRAIRELRKAEAWAIDKVMREAWGTDHGIQTSNKDAARSGD